MKISNWAVYNDCLYHGNDENSIRQDIILEQDTPTKIEFLPHSQWTPSIWSELYSNFLEDANKSTAIATSLRMAMSECNISDEQQCAVFNKLIKPMEY